MARGRSVDFTEILLRRSIISPVQLREAEQMSNRDGKQSVADCLIKLGYASGEEVMRALAQQHGMDYVDLREVTIPDSVIEFVPESVARENVVLPLAVDEDAIKIIASNPNDLETIDKLRFILNRKIDVALAPRESILESINRYYGQIEGESADSILQEFTDTAIDFTATDNDPGGADEAIDENSAPVVKLVQLMIT